MASIPCTTHLPFTFKPSTSPSSLSKFNTLFLGTRNRLGWLRPCRLGPSNGYRTKCWFKFGKNGVDAEGAGIYGSQSRDDFDRDDVEQYFNYMGMLAVEGSYDKMNALLSQNIHPVDILLMMAASEGDKPKIEELLRAGARYDVKDADGRTAIERVLTYMEYIEDPFESCSSRDEKEEALDLLVEKCWFFDNSLNRRTRMSRCNSDICSSSSFAQEMQVKNSGDANALSTGKLGEDDDFDRPDLVRLPSPPPCFRREEETREDEITHSMSQLNLQGLDQVWFQTQKQLPTSTGSEEKESDSRRTTFSGQSTQRHLLRTPSLPPHIGREDIIQDTQNHPHMNKSSREAPPNLPRHKSMRQSYSLSRYRPARNIEGGLINQSKLRKSLSDLELEEVQGFKDLGFTFDKNVSPSVVKILPGLQEKKPEDLDEDKVSRPYLSDAWFVQSSPRPVPNYVRKGSAEDMKAQIKFWAKAVASNVR